MQNPNAHIVVAIGQFSFTEGVYGKPSCRPSQSFSTRGAFGPTCIGIHFRRQNKGQCPRKSLQFQFDDMIFKSNLAPRSEDNNSSLVLFSNLYFGLSERKSRGSGYNCAEGQCRTWTKITQFHRSLIHLPYGQTLRTQKKPLTQLIRVRCRTPKYVFLFLRKRKKGRYQKQVALKAAG